MSGIKDNIQYYFFNGAKRYDLVNDFLSFGLHRFWKRKTISFMPSGRSFLDLASGTGDLAFLLQKKHPKARVTAADLNPAMLDAARSKDKRRRLHYLIMDAENMSFKPKSFDGVTVGFGLRNFQKRAHVLQSIHRILKPGGTFLCLEFGRPVFPPWRWCYRLYLFFLPFIAVLFGGRYQMYRYLAVSIRAFPPQDVVRQMIQRAGFSCQTHLFLNGIAVLYVARKLNNS